MWVLGLFGGWGVFDFLSYYRGFFGVLLLDIFRYGMGDFWGVRYKLEIIYSRKGVI